MYRKRFLVLLKLKKVCSSFLRMKSSPFCNIHKNLSKDNQLKQLINKAYYFKIMLHRFAKQNKCNTHLLKEIFRLFHSCLHEKNLFVLNKNLEIFRQKYPHFIYNITDSKLKSKKYKIKYYNNLFRKKLNISKCIQAYKFLLTYCNILTTKTNVTFYRKYHIKIKYELHEIIYHLCIVNIDTHKNIGNYYLVKTLGENFCFFTKQNKDIYNTNVLAYQNTDSNDYNNDRINNEKTSKINQNCLYDVLKNSIDVTFNDFKYLEIKFIEYLKSNKIKIKSVRKSSDDLDRKFLNVFVSRIFDLKLFMLKGELSDEEIKTFTKIMTKMYHSLCFYDELNWYIIFEKLQNEFMPLNLSYFAWIKILSRCFGVYDKFVSYGY